MRRRELDTKVVIQAQTGDEQALALVLSRLDATLRAFFTGRIGGRTEVDDLVQNTLLRVHNSLVDLKDPARLKAFAMKAALFELQDYYRGRYRPKEPLYDPEVPQGQLEGEAESGARFDVARALEALSPRARRIVELREYGYRYEEIAEMVGTTEAAIKMQVKRAFEKMRSVLTSVLVLILLLHS